MRTRMYCYQSVLLAALVALVVVVVLPLPLLAQATNLRPDLSGVWQLDAEASDDLEKAFQDLALAARAAREGDESGGPRRGRGGRGGRGGARQGAGQGGGSGKSEGRHGDPDQPPRLGASLALLLINQDGQSFEVVDADDRVWRVTTDGKPQTMAHGRGEATGRAHWQDSILVENWQLGERLDLTRRYTLAANGEDLLVTITVAHQGVPDEATANLVYHQP